MIDVTPVRLEQPPALAAAGERSGALLVVLGLAAFVAASHLETAVEAFGASPAVSLILVAIAAGSARWAVQAARRPTRRTLATGAAGAIALLALWVCTRTIGLPFGLAEPVRIGALDAVTAADELLLACFALAAMRAPSSPGQRWSAIGGAAISISFIALAMGCSSAQPAQASPTAHGVPVTALCHLY